METLNTPQIIKILDQKDLALFTLTDFSHLFKIENINTLYKRLHRLQQKGIIQKLTQGKYLFILKKPDEFVMANFLYQPSYISLESALSFHGIITGFPYQVTSITTKKSKTFLIEGREYIYSQITPALFWGYEKKEKFLIANQEKALIDFFYLAFKGLRELNLDELDLSLTDKENFNQYLNQIRNQKFLKYLQNQKL